MLKAVGALLICGASLLLGWKKSAALDQRIRLLDEMEKSLGLLSGEIRYGAATLPEAMRSTAARTKGVAGQFYGAVAHRISTDPGKPFCNVWEEAVSEILCSEEGIPKDAEILQELGTQLGHLDVSMQLEAIELSISRIRHRQEEAGESKRSKSRIYKTCAAACGVLLTLILL